MTADLFSVVKLICFKAVSLKIILNTPYHIAYGIIQTTCYIMWLISVGYRIVDDFLLFKVFFRISGNVFLLQDFLISGVLGWSVCQSVYRHVHRTLASPFFRIIRCFDSFFTVRRIIFA